MFTNNRNAYRQTFSNAWQKYLKKLPLETLEMELVEIILLHPEYQSFLENTAQIENQEFALEENPFLHMSLHIAIREQIKTNRPAGIKTIYQRLLLQYPNPHDVEHHMIQCLAQLLWQGQQMGEMPKDEVYLEMLKQL